MKTCLYRHYAKDGSLLYIGMSNTALGRLNGHKRAKASWLDQIARVEIEWFASREEAHTAEREAIQLENPRYNRRRYQPKPGKPIDRRTPNRQTQKRRLERAGFVHVSGWVPAAYAAKVAYQIATYSDDVEKVLNEPAKPRGRPKAIHGQGGAA